ncbi:UvrD-helicase domain-containing protein [Dokdonia sp.]|uniref:UvrD-helicase domain-containing protein n=1 Tax=Dokdonia sp. TaxID=2024995 RepID=UPI0032677335
MNKAIFSCAGSRKTTMVIDDSISLFNSEKKVLILTYTIINKDELKNRINSQLGFIPKNLSVLTWVSFLINECVRPYQNISYNESRISGITFIQGQSATYIDEKKIKGHYITTNENLYSDKLAKFAVKCNQDSSGLAIQRLEQLWDYIFVDEAQDLASYDLDIIALLFKSKIKIIVVGDIRQVVYSTHHAKRLSQYRKEKAIDFYREAEKRNLCKIIERNECFRSIQIICDFADIIFPELTKTLSKYKGSTDHQGIFAVHEKDVQKYYEEYTPIVLRHSKSSNTFGLSAINFGKSKGQTYERVLIFPTKPVRDFLKSGDISFLKDKHKFYVSVTRASESIAFVYNSKSIISMIQEY